MDDQDLPVFTKEFPLMEHFSPIESDKNACLESENLVFRTDHHSHKHRGAGDL
jgi:hypothetical protein